jgi:hypothetical protein
MPQIPTLISLQERHDFNFAAAAASSFLHFASMRPFYFRSGESFLHFTELCLFSYPSPLENNAPVVAKLVLLALAGSIEYFVLSIVTDLLVTYSGLILLLLGLVQGESVSGAYNDALLALLFALSFALRARRSVGVIAVPSKHRRPSTSLLRRLAAHLFWNNPALVCHCVLLLWSHVTGRPRIRIETPRYFWVLIAPTLELGEVHLDATGKKKHKSFTSIIWYSLGIAMLNILVTVGPSLLIALALVAQSAAYQVPRVASDKATGDKSLLEKLDASPVFHPLRSGMEALDAAVSLALSRLARAGAACHGRALDSIARLTLGEAKLELYKDEVQTKQGQFRLLTILPGSGNHPIRCSLQCCSVDAKVKYAAVSYCWGSSDLTHQVIVNGTPLPVTRSAFEVLHALRSLYRTKVVWIDYLCINQATERDKTHQLPLMPRIYENSSQVIVWLGRSKTADLAVALVNRMFLINRLRSTSEIKPLEYQITIEGARALKRMLKTGWFTRVWVVQEVVRARHKVNIRYGQSSLTWERFSWFTQSLQLDGSQLAMLSTRIGHSGLDKVAALQNVSMMRRFALVKDERLSLMFYLGSIYRSSSIFEATKPHDRIYSLSGLSGLSNVNLEPDYSTPLRQLFIDVVKNALQTGVPRHRLAFLSHAGTGYNPTVPGLPSWAPDWTIRIKSEPLIGSEGGSELLVSSAVKPVMHDAAALASFGQQDDAEARVKRSQRIRSQVEEVGDRMKAMIFDATPSTEPCVVLHGDDSLELKGRRLGHIVSLGREYPLAGGTHDSLTVLAEWLDLFMKQSPNLSQTERAHLFFRMLHHGQADVRLDYTFSRMPIPFEMAYPADIHVALWTCIQYRQFNDPACSAPLLNLYIALARRFQQTCGGRCFGVTNEGHFGLFFPSNAIGDFACLFSGAKLPFGIRSVAAGGPDEMFELIGPVYIEGIMRGILGVPSLFDEMIRLR